MKPKLILIGGGGHCKSCIDVIERQGKYQIAGIVDTHEKKKQHVLGYEIIACDDELTELSKQYSNFLITVGQIRNPGVRISLFNRLKKENVCFPTIVSPRAYISLHARIGEGTIVMRGFGVADAAHVAFAEECGAKFITCDDRLIKKCKKHNIRVWCDNPMMFCLTEKIQ